MMTGWLRYLVPGTADRDAGLLPIGDSARQRDGIGLPEEYSYVRNSSAPPMFVNDIGGRAPCAAAFSQRASAARGWLGQVRLATSLPRISGPFIAVAIWWFLPVALIPTDGEANDYPESRNPRIAHQVVCASGGPEYDRDISG
jgi:hypothetical protein